MFKFMKTFTVRANYECRKDGILPGYLGSTIRGILGHCIRETYCQEKDKKCFLCERREDCMYVRCFNNTGGEAGAVNPYNIYVHGQGKEKWEKGDTCVFDLTLLGTATEYAEVYLEALIDAEKKGWGAARLPFRLIHVTDPKSGKMLYARGKSWMHNLNPTILSVEERNASSACINFDTPLRIVSSGKLLRNLPFDVLIQFLSRRMSLITQKYTDVCLEWDTEMMLQQAAQIRIADESWREVPFSRYSINQKTGKLELDAISGWVLYEGDLSCFVPLLEAGKYLHIGKGATIGFGHYEVFYDS